jgi:glutamate synthase (NADPH/NADH) small chain
MKKEAVAIGHLERFAADYERISGQISIPEITPANGIKIAVVGSGPSGLSFAGDLVKSGYSVTVFEELHEIGGVLKYGIPVFRLPNEIVDVEINNLRAMGIKFVNNCIVGKTVSIDDLKDEGFRGIFVGSGAGLPRFMNIKGENLVGVMSANEYLTRVNLMDAANPESDTPVLTGKKVAVIGGGNTAMDSVRTALRLGAERAMIIYRRSEEEMPARLEEVKHAKEEGIEFMTLRNPIEYRGNEHGRVTHMLLQVMKLGEPDASGRRSPVEIPGETELIEVDEVVVSVGVSPNPLIPRSVEGLNVSKWGTIVVNEETMQSDIPMIFAGGDIVRGGATVILAMGDGRRAAKAMDKGLREGSYKYLQKMLKTLLLVGLGGGLGSMLRYLATCFITNRITRFPAVCGTFAVNFTGCLLIGIAIGLSERYNWFTPQMRWFVVTGICGGYTTFSAFAYENINLMRNGNYSASLIYIFASVMICFFATYIGFIFVEK